MASNYWIIQFIYTLLNSHDHERFVNNHKTAPTTFFCVKITLEMHLSRIEPRK